MRSRTEDGGGGQSRAGPSPGSGGGGAGKDGERASTVERSGVKVEKVVEKSVGGSGLNVGGTASSVSGAVAMAGSGMGGSVGGGAGGGESGLGGSVGRLEKSLGEKKVTVLAEKKVVNGGGKAEVAMCGTQEKRVTGSPVREKTGAIGEVAGPAGAANGIANAVPSANDEVEAGAEWSVAVGSCATTKLEVEKRWGRVVFALDGMGGDVMWEVDVGANLGLRS